MKIVTNKSKIAYYNDLSLILEQSQ